MQKSVHAEAELHTNDRLNCSLSSKLNTADDHNIKASNFIDVINHYQTICSKSLNLCDLLLI